MQLHSTVRWQSSIAALCTRRPDGFSCIAIYVRLKWVLIVRQNDRTVTEHNISRSKWRGGRIRSMFVFGVFKAISIAHWDVAIDAIVSFTALHVHIHVILSQSPASMHSCILNRSVVSLLFRRLHKSTHEEKHSAVHMLGEWTSECTTILDNFHKIEIQSNRSHSICAPQNGNIRNGHTAIIPK